MEPVGGIQPPSSVYKTAALALSYTGMVARGGVAPPFPAYQAGVFLLDDPALWWNGEDSNLHLLFFKQALRPHQLPFRGVRTGDRTRTWRITLSRSRHLSYTHHELAKARGIEPRSAVLETAVFPLDDAFEKQNRMVNGEGFEPPTPWM